MDEDVGATKLYEFGIEWTYLVAEKQRSDAQYRSEQKKNFYNDFCGSKVEEIIATANHYRSLRRLIICIDQYG